MSACAAERDIDFCSECGAYPCDNLRRFQSAMAHRIELWINLERIRSAGHQQWLGEIRGRYICPQYRTLNSAYDLKWWKCGEEPSCAYVVTHRQAIEAYLKNR